MKATTVNKADWPDFHTLTSAQVEKLLAEADRMKYRKPKNANGSRARYFYARLERRGEWLNGL